MDAVKALLAHAVDYAGLFPPASLGMEQAVRNYRRYRTETDSGGEFAWMLGHFVVGAQRLGEFADSFERVCCGEREEPWTLSVVCSGDPAADMRAMEEFQQGAAFISAIETRVASPEAAEALLVRTQDAPTQYVEFAPAMAESILPMLRSHRARAKLRTGGVTADAIPAAEAVAGFMMACRRAGVAFKATAGLHHAARGVRRLTYQAQSPQATMHGFINVLLAAGLIFHGGSREAAVKTLLEEDSGMFRLEENAIAWHDHRLTTEQILEVRGQFAIGFGSCSFTEPVEDLKAMRWV